MSADITAQRSRGVRVLGLSFAALFVLLCILALLAYLGWHSTPAYWVQEQKRLAEIPTPQREAISESFHNRILTQWSDPGKAIPVTQDDLFGHRQKIAIAYDELNTWIATDGVELLDVVGIELPDTVQRAMIDSPGDGLLRISCQLDQLNSEQVISLSFKIEIADDGTITSTLKGATAGQLPLPVESAISLIAKESDQGVMLDLMLGNPIPPIELPIDPSKDGARDGRLVGLDVGDENMVITRETVRRKKAN